MNRTEKFKLIGPGVLPILPCIVYLQFGMAIAIVLSFVIVPMVMVVKRDSRIYGNNAMYYKYCSIVLVGTFLGIFLSSYFVDFGIVIRLIMVLLNLGMMYQYVDKIESLSDSDE